MLEALANGPFLLHNAQGFSQYVLFHALQAREMDFEKHVRCIGTFDVPPDANTISSQAIYKIIVDEGASLRLEAIIGPQGHEDSLICIFKSDCCLSSPTAIGIVSVIAAVRRWRLAKADVNAAFLQTGLADRDLNARPLRESNNRRLHWLLIDAAYGLVNANAKFQNQTNEVVLDI